MTMTQAKKKLCIVTATRAEYALLLPVIRKLSARPELDVRVAVTGSHLCPEFGLTLRQIEADGITVDKKIEMLLASDTPASVSKSMGLAMIGFGDYFTELQPDALLVLGDRYELLAICSAAMNARIPVIHLYGGETTEGAVDEAVRHAVTKLSCLHFAANETYAKRIIQMGETPERVHVVGAMGPENALQMEKMTRSEIEERLGISLGGCHAIVTFHPVTLENETAETQAAELVRVFEHYPDITFVCTKANADANGRVINAMLQHAAEQMDNVFLFDSLGARCYLSVAETAAFALGNSSSGLSEMPSLGVPTVNIGDRQKGRLRGPSVIDCAPDCASVCSAVDRARTPEFRQIAQQRVNPYGDGNTSSRIAELVTDALVQNRLELKKKFFDIDFQL